MSALRAVTPQLVNGTTTEVSPAEVKKYKDIIRDQDSELTQLRELMNKVQKDLESVGTEKEGLVSKVQQLHDENTGTLLYLSVLHYAFYFIFLWCAI